MCSVDTIPPAVFNHANLANMTFLVRRALKFVKVLA